MLTSLNVKHTAKYGYRTALSSYHNQQLSSFNRTLWQFCGYNVADVSLVCIGFERLEKIRGIPSTLEIATFLMKFPSKYALACCILCSSKYNISPIHSQLE